MMVPRVMQIETPRPPPHTQLSFPRRSLTLWAVARQMGHRILAGDHQRTSPRGGGSDQGPQTLQQQQQQQQNYFGAPHYPP